MKGVTPIRWMALIAFEGVRYYLGTFSNKEKAHAAYQAAARKLHGKFRS